MKKQASEKLSISKNTLKNLTLAAQTGVKAGACSKNWSYSPSKGPAGCSSKVKADF